MNLAPLGNDAAATAYHAGQAVGGQVHVFQADAAVDGEVVYALLALLNERVAEQFPRQVLGLAVHLLHGLIHRHRADGYRAVAHNPLARLVNVGTRGKVHQRIAAPLAAPHGLFHLLLNAGGRGGVTDVGVDFHQEVAADNHRLGFGVVDVGRQHGAAGGNFVAHELGRDVGLDAQFGAVHVFADGHVLHFRRNHALTGVVELRNLATLLGTQRQGDVLKAQGVERVVVAALAAVLRRNFGQALHATALQNPRLTQAGQTFFQVDVNVPVAVRTTGVVHINRRIGAFHASALGVNAHRGRKVYPPHSHTQVGI